MLRTLRAFAWMRWRMLVNSLEQSGARDTMERFSMAIENLGPIMAGILMVPSAVALAGLGAAAGYALASGSADSPLIQIIRFLLFAVPILCVVGPLFLPAGDRTNPVRMLLLPISRATMYVAQSASAFGDPWILLLLPVVLGVPLGLAAGGAIGATVVALAGGLLLLVVVLGIASLAASVLHLAVRDRRRGELLALIFIMVLPLIGLVPMMMNSQQPRDARGRRVPRPPAERVVPTWMANAGERAFAALPTELYVRATRQAAQDNPTRATMPLLGLAITGFLLHALSMRLFNNVLDSPGTTTARRSAPMRAIWGRTLPLLSAPASAVALAQLRLALRTPRGRSIMVSPLLIFVMFGVMMYRGGGKTEFGPFDFQSGLGLATFVSVAALMSILPIAMNQFAVDKSGLTLALLSPLSERDYLIGKAVGNSVITGIPTVLGVALAAAAFPGGPLALWLCIPLALLSISFVVAPVAAILSALFPRVVELNSIGRGSNAHGLAGLLGLGSFLVAGAPCILLVLLATRWLERPTLAPVFLLAWCVLAFGIGLVLFIPARKIFVQRRENFAMLV
jgi:hypothetical protein